MGDRRLVGLWVLLALGALFWFAGGAGLFRDTPGGDGGAAARDPADLLDAGAGEGASQDGSAAGGKPVLFGRAREQRAGVGGLRGRVMDFRSSAPVGSARVVLAGAGYAGELVALQGESDAQGHFRFGDVPAGDGYTLHVQVAEGGQRTLGGVALPAGGEEDVGTLWLGERGALEGVVVDAAGEGVVGAQVQVHRGGSLLAMLEGLADLMEQMDQDAKPMAQTETGARGRFRVPDLDPGPVLVVVRARGFRQQIESGVMTAAGAAGGEMRIQVEASDPLAGHVVDEAGRGIAGARVACMDQNDMDGALFGRLFVRTDGAGAFRIDSPPASDAHAMVVAAEGRPTLFTQARAGRGPLRLVMQGGVELVLRFGEGVSGRPVVGARVMAAFGDAEHGMEAQEMNFAAGATDGQGEARFVAREGQLTMVFFSHGDFGSGMYAPSIPVELGTGILEGPKDATIRKPRTTLAFRVVPGLTLAGRVLDEQQRGIPGARVNVLGGAGLGATAVSDEDGGYELRGVTRTITAVLARAPGYVQEEATLAGDGQPPEPDAHGLMHRDVVMLRAATVAGVVRGPDGVGLAGVRVKAGSEDGFAMLAALTGRASEGLSGQDGRYVLDGVPPGRRTYVMARMPGYLDARSADFEVLAGQAHTAPDVALRRGTTLDVLVEDPAGRPCPGARVEVSVPQSADRMHWDALRGLREFADVTSRKDGRVLVRDVPDGRVTLTASHGTHAGARVVQDVVGAEGGGTVEVRVSLRGAVQLEGRVLDASGNGVHGAHVSSASLEVEEDAQGDDWIPALTARTDEGGRFVLERLPARAMRLQVAAEGYRSVHVAVGNFASELEVRLERMEAGTTARLAQIQEEIQALYVRYSKAKDASERTALLERIANLDRERKELGGE